MIKLSSFGVCIIFDQMHMGDLELGRCFQYRTSLWRLVHSLCIIFPGNLGFRKSAIAMSIFTETSDHGDFRDLDRESRCIHYILRLDAGDLSGPRKSRSKKRINFFSVYGGSNVVVYMRKDVQNRILRRLVW